MGFIDCGLVELQWKQMQESQTGVLSTIAVHALRMPRMATSKISWKIGSEYWPVIPTAMLGVLPAFF